MAARLLSKTFLLPVRGRFAVSALSYPARCKSSGQPLTQEVSEELSDEAIFSHEHVELRRSLNKIIENDINPHVDEWENAKIFPAHQVFKKLGDAGFLGVNRPPEYGGLGLDYSYNVAVAEELGNIKCGAIPMAIGVQTDMATPALARFGSDLVKKEFLAPSISGDKVACLGVSEVGAGSDVSSIKTTAKKSGGDYIINGGKMWTTNGLQADWMCLLANTSDGPPHRNKSLICLPMDLPGIEKAKIDKIGMWSSDTAQIFLEDVRVPQSYLIGDEGMGFTYQMLQFQEERLWGAAASIVPLDTVINETAEYTKQRKIFGQPLLNNQAVHFKLAELQTEVECLRSLIYRATGMYIQGKDVTKLASMAKLKGGMYIQGKDVTKLASMAKLKGGRLAREVTDCCLQYWGGMGYTSDVMVSRAHRDFRLLSIGGGADEVMMSIIAKYMGTLPKLKPQ